jgi:1-aminocyclopropane-1-carboxylate deaminase
VAELMAAIEQQLPYLNHLVAACGTGGTLAGLIGSASSTYSILGVPVLKGGGFLEADIKALLRQAAISEKCQWRLDLEGHYGGYGKVKTAHLEAMQRIESEHNVELEPIYTAKMWRRFDELVQADYFTAGDSIALLHSGGVQGRRSFKLMGIKE